MDFRGGLQAYHRGPAPPRSSSRCRWSRPGHIRQYPRCTEWGRYCTRPGLLCRPQEPRNPGPVFSYSC